MLSFVIVREGIDGVRSWSRHANETHGCWDVSIRPGDDDAADSEYASSGVEAASPGC